MAFALGVRARSSRSAPAGGRRPARDSAAAGLTWRTDAGSEPSRPRWAAYRSRRVDSPLLLGAPSPAATAARASRGTSLGHLAMRVLAAALAVALVATPLSRAQGVSQQHPDPHPHDGPLVFCRRPESAFPRPPTTDASVDAAEMASAPEPEPEPAPKAQDLGCHCEEHKDVMFRAPGTQTGGVRQVSTRSATDCCNECRTDPTNECTHYTWTPVGQHAGDAAGKSPHNCMLLPHGSGEVLIKTRVAPSQNRTSGFLKRFSPTRPAPPPTPGATPTPTPTPSGRLSKEKEFEKELEEPWVPYGGLSLVGVSLLVCFAAVGRRSGRAALGDPFALFKRGKGFPTRTEYEPIGEASPAPAAVAIEVDCGSVDTDSLTSSSRAVSSVSSISDGMLAYDQQTFDDFVDDFLAAVSKLVRDRKRLLWTYEQCFVGSEALEWIKHWVRAAGDDGSDERADALAQKLLDLQVITNVTADASRKFVASQFYRVEIREEEEDDDDSVVSSEFPSEVSHTSTMMDFDLRSSEEMHQYEQAVQVLSAALNTGVRPSDACLTRLSMTIPPLLAASVRLRALASSSSTPNLVALLDQSTEVEAEVKAKKPDADIAEHARALQEALQQRDDLTTHTLYTKADRLRMTVLALKHEAADATRRYNLRNCPMLAVLSVDGVRTTVMRHLCFTDLCRMRSVCQASAEFVAEILHESAMPTIFGGLDGGRAIASVDQLCGARMQWSRLPPMLTARYDPGACRISAGRVIVAGGRDETNVLRSAEEFDPDAGRWSALPPMETARLGCRALRLANGRIVVMGGFDGRRAVASVEAYCPATRSWTPLRDMPTARTGFAAGTLLDGTIVVAGGFGAGGALSAVEQYTPATDEWHSLPSMALERSGCDGCVAASGELWVAGGMSKGERLDSCEVLRVDAETGSLSWSTAPSMQFGRHKLGLCTIAGQLVAMGGEGTPVSPRGRPAQKDVKCVEVFDDMSQQWKQLVDLPDTWATSRGCTSI